MRIFAVLGGGLLVVAVAAAAARAGVRPRGQDADSAARRLRRGCTSTRKGTSPATRARPRSARTSGRRWRRRSPTSCACRSTSVTMVMADTDLVPFDQGTFGSQSTPRMAPQLARAAATAREMLIDRAAALLAGGPRDADARGRTRHRRRGPLAWLGELTEGPEADGHVAADAPVAPPAAVDAAGHGARRRSTAATS